MLILLDQDGVLANFEQGFITNWHQRFGEEPPIAGQDHLFYVRDRLPEQLRHPAADAAAHGRRTAGTGSLA